MATEKIVQYTQEQTAQMTVKYLAGETVEAIAEALGKSVRSVIAKLSREGVYKSKEKTSTATRVTKTQLIDLIAAKVDVPAEKLESLEKATKEALEILEIALR